MTTAEKLQKIDEGVEETIALNAELEQTLYGTDVDKTLNENVEQTESDFRAIKDKIVEHGVEVADGTKTAEYASKVDDVFEAGKKAQHDEFWDGILDSPYWQNKFFGPSWNDNTFYPHKDIKPTGYSNSLFETCKISDLAGRLRECDVRLDTSGIGANVRIDRMFYWSNVTTVPYIDLRNASWSNGILEGMFYNCANLKTIEGIHLADDGSQKLGKVLFNGCRKLEDVTFYGTIGGDDSIFIGHSALLSKASITNIIGCLSTSTSGLSITFSRQAVQKAFETSSGANDGNTSAEWLSIIDTRPNWTISLVTT